MPRRDREPEPAGNDQPEAPRHHWVWRLLWFAFRPVRRAWSSDDTLDDFALVHMTSAMGDAFFAIALADSVFFSVPVGEARTKVAAYLLLTVAPLAVAAPLLVPLLDRAGPRRAISTTAALGRAALAVYLAPRAGTNVLFGVAFGMLVLSRIHGITKNGLTVAYAPPDEGGVKSNARLGRWAVVGVLVAAGPGVAVLKLGGMAPLLYVAAAAFVISGLLNLRLPQPRVREAAGIVARRGRVPELAVAAFGVGALRAAAGFLVFLLAFALRSNDQPAYWFGVLAGAATAGGFIGDILAPRTPRRLREEGLVLSAFLIAAVAAVAAFEVYGLGALAVFCATAGMATEFGRLAFQSLMQRLVPVGAQGRAFVRYEVAFQLAWVAGAFIPAMVDMRFKSGVMILGAFYVVVGAVYVALPALDRRYRISPPPDGANGGLQDDPPDIPTRDW